MHIRPRTLRRLQYRVAEALTARGYSEDDVAQMVSRMDAAMVGGEIDRHPEVFGTVGAFGDGKIIQWLIDHGPQIVALVKLIVTLLAVFATKPPEPDGIEADNEPITEEE